MTDDADELSNPDQIIQQAVEEARLNHLNRQPVNLFKTAKGSIGDATITDNNNSI